MRTAYPRSMTPGRAASSAPRPAPDRAVTTPHPTAAQALVAQLHANGVRHVFTVPGESLLPVLYALYESRIAVTTCRH